eukprot:4401018-Prymnesium_polylepis.2
MARAQAWAAGLHSARVPLLDNCLMCALACGERSHSKEAAQPAGNGHRRTCCRTRRLPAEAIRRASDAFARRRCRAGMISRVLRM